MHVSTHELPTKVDAPGAVARHLPDFGATSGPLAAEHFTMAAGTDLAPLLQGLQSDLCQSAHWGYIIRGAVVVTYDDGTEERCVGGEVVHWPEGHTVRVEDDAELVLFSPPSDHGPVLDHIASQVAAAT